MTRKMKRTLFFILLGILGLFIIYESQKLLAEPFQNSSPSLNIPKVNPQVQPVQVGDPQPFTPTSTALLSPPPGQTASVNSYPTKDPARQPATLKRIKGVYQTLKGFVQNEMGKLEHLGDPSIKLPLGSLKADYRRLEDETFVITKNPGVESTLTEDDVKGIEANLRYLQKKWRLSVNSLDVEGFQGGASQGSANLNATGQTENIPDMPSNVEGFTSSSSKATISTDDLNDLSLKIGIEIVRLQASGTTDPVISRRVTNLTKIKASVDDIITQVKSGQITEAEIPILKSDYDAFLPVMSNLDSNLPTLISGAGISNILNNLFPMYGAGDISGADLARSIFDKYAKDLMKNLSWSLNLNYTGETESNIAKDLANSISNAANIKEKTSRGDDDSADGPYSAAPKTSYRGMFDSLIKKGENTTQSSTTSESNKSTDSTAATDPSVSGPPAKLDWKKRAADICEQASRRGLNPYDFGCMADTSAVSETFSFRGYTKMICNRLSTNYDPGIPEICGCPPPTWSGWRG